MDIQMMLSALPGKPMGKAETGANASQGQFALALAGAGRSQSNAQLSDPLPDSVRPVLPPSMAAQLAMLQALSASDPDLVADLEPVPLPDTLSLADIMERLALIEGNQPAETRPLGDATDPQTINMQTVAEQAAVAARDSSADHAVAALVAADALRQAPGDPARTLETSPAGSAVALLNASLAQPQQAIGHTVESTPHPALLTQLETRTVERPQNAGHHALESTPRAAPLAQLETGSAERLRQTHRDDIETTPHPALLTQLETRTAERPQNAGHYALESTPRAALLTQLETSTSERPLRTGEFARSVNIAPQPSTSELRGITAEAPRPTMASIEPTSPSLQTAQQPAGTATQVMPAPATPAQASLPAPVQGQAWTGQLGQQLVQFARLGGEQQIEMKLNPAELGPLSITLKMTEQGAQAQFLSAHAQVRQVLEQAIPQLREALAEQGISLGETSVGEQRHQEGQAFANQENHRGSGADETEVHLPSAADIGLVENATGVSLDGRVNLYA
ncbi:flagellar hook-length control protein FliK [Halomonas sp. ANAO-440]|uniref:flagellar hook-length control protein FliK n=1 Tax=Halomonas sp. ANAO-440 TaxID=2861360 RepID=UPI001CAA43C7|nr:flagellar hook-length control protein FliK [Halomonas sp. ANAO-440]MBZ0329285.1 flagellar hook-length control protein FliK [Halomonas sp. ANAO-440]